ncbi:MAG: DUF1731 domain-containing protein [Micromonosporaceae bacterium]|nr:DUF1731 domain-containing protein [Micromonosporaceae bacterium]
MRIVIAGSSGLIGTALRRSCRQDGHTVIRLVRREPAAPDEARWDPAATDSSLLDGADVVVNLAGAGLGDRRWTRARQELLLRSRTSTARSLASAAAEAARPPKLLLSASGIRWYGIDRGDEILTESSAATPAGFLDTVAHQWEAATAPASDAGIPVCQLRLGLVLSRHGGVLAPMLPLFRAGLGVRFMSGREHWSYVSLTDAVRAIRFLASRPASEGPCGPSETMRDSTGRCRMVSEGPYNITSPNPLPNRELIRALADAVGTRVVAPAPRWALRIGLGRIANEVFGGLRVIPGRLMDAGFRFAHPDPASALRDALDQG